MLNKTALAAVPALLFLCSAAVAGEIYVTGLSSSGSGDGAVYEIIINDAVLIRDVMLVDAGGTRYLKFPEYDSQKKRVYPHLLRHSLATNLLHRGAHLLAIKEQLGHAFVETTMIYVHSNADHTQMQYRMYAPSYL